MKKTAKFNRTKTVVLLIIALLGLYVISIKSAPMAMRSSFGSQQISSLSELKLKLNSLQSEYYNTPNTNISRKAQLAAQIASLQAEIKGMETGLQRPGNITRPKS